jgi:hypothetical protein
MSFARCGCIEVGEELSACYLKGTKGAFIHMKGGTCETVAETATLDVVFGVFSTAPQHMGLVALNSFYTLVPNSFTVSTLYALAVF